MSPGAQTVSWIALTMLVSGDEVDDPEFLSSNTRQSQL